MSASPSSTPRWKVALIPILLVVFGYVLWPAADRIPGVAPGGHVATATAQVSPSGKGVVVPPLPKFDVEVAVGFNPFQTPTAIRDLIHGIPELEQVDSAAELLAAQEQVSQQEARMDKLRRLKVSLILSGKEGKAAIVGSKIVRVGDQIEPGVRVVRIDDGGLLLRMEQETPSDVR